MPYQNVTLAQLQAFVQGRLASPTFWTLQEMTDALNDGLKLYGLATGRWKDRFQIQTTSDRVIYDLTSYSNLQPGGATAILAPIRVVFQGVGSSPQPLAWSSFSDMDFSFPNWQIQNTRTPGAPNTPMTWGFWGGLNMIFIWPADATSVNSLQLDCLLTAPVLVNSGDYVNLDLGDIQALIGYAVHVCAWKRGGLEFQKTMPMYTDFLKMCAGRNGYLRTISPFKEAIGEDSARRMRPRRQSEGTGQPDPLGVR